jgi:hypothetical protein
MRNAGGLALALGLLGLMLACDPGYSFRPEGWHQDRYGWWSTDRPGFKVRLIAPGNLIGAHSLSPEPEITNTSLEPLTIMRAELESKGSVFEAALPGRGEAQWRTVKAGTTLRVPMSFHFAQPVYEALGPKLTLRVFYRLGDGPIETLEVSCART